MILKRKLRTSFNTNRRNKFLYRINGQIAAASLRILDQDGKQIGILTRNQALDLAQEKGLDLVEVAERADPPVAKIIDYSKFLYQLKKKKQEEKKKNIVSVTKEIRLGPFIGEHDLDIKLNKAREFYKDGDKVKFTVRFRGRQFEKKDIGKNLLRRITDKLQEIAKVDRDIHEEGRQITMITSRIKTK